MRLLRTRIGAARCHFATGKRSLHQSVTSGQTLRCARGPLARLKGRTIHPRNMQPHAAERRHLERQITYARPIFMVLALGDLLERPPQDRGPHAVAFVLVYLGVALGLAAAAIRSQPERVACSAVGGSGGAGAFSFF